MIVLLAGSAFASRAKPLYALPLADFLRSTQRLHRIGSLQTDKMPLLLYLTGQPVNIAASIDATHWILSAFHPISVTLFAVTLSTPIGEDMAGYED